MTYVPKHYSVVHRGDLYTHFYYQLEGVPLPGLRVSRNNVEMGPNKRNCT